MHGLEVLTEAWLSDGGGETDLEAGASSQGGTRPEEFELLIASRGVVACRTLCPELSPPTPDSR